MPRGGPGIRARAPQGHFRSDNPNAQLLESMWHLAAKNAMYVYPRNAFMMQLATDRYDSGGKVTDSSQCKQVVEDMRANEQCVMTEVDEAFHALLSNMELLITKCTNQP